MKRSLAFLGIFSLMLALPSCQDNAPTLTVVDTEDGEALPLGIPGVFRSVLEVEGSVQGDASRTPADIACDGATTVEIDLISQNSITANPTDVMLVLDRSGSMTGTPLANLKTAANQFVDIIDEASDGVLDGVIDGSRVGVVSFASNVTLNQALTSNAAAVKAAINSLSAGGGTYVAPGINTAQAQLAGSNPGSLKIMIIVSDGQAMDASAASTAAANARAAFTEIFAIGFGSVSVSQLNNWATDPDDEHVFVTPSSDELEQVFQDIGADIIQPGGSNITLQASVFDHFDITSGSWSKGMVSFSGNVVTWTIDELYTETVTLILTVQHDPAYPGGVEQLVTSITYTDDEGNTPTFPDLSVNVRGCAAAIDVTPDAAVNELGPDVTHSVTATVSDDFGDPVANITVGFGILSGPNAGVSGSGNTDANGEVGFTYPATQGLAGLGTDEIEGCFTNGAGDEVCDTVTKEWVDTTPPDVSCPEGVNPAGNPPTADNEDGFYFLEAFDVVDPDPQIYVDAGEGVIFGPFASGTNIKYTEMPGGKPRIRAGPGEVDWVIAGTQDLMIYAVDASGNQAAPFACLVAPPPKRP
jgi:uncharacterized protein YegL